MADGWAGPRQPRRGAWLLATLAGCGLMTGIGMMVLVSAQSDRDGTTPAPIAAMPQPVIAAHRSVATASLDPDRRATAPRATNLRAREPFTTASITAQRPAPASDDALRLRHITEFEIIRGPSAAVERAAGMAARAALAELRTRDELTDKPGVIAEVAPLVQVASLGVPTNFTVLTKRQPAAPEPEARGDANTIVISEGDTLYEILDASGIQPNEAVEVARALAEVFPTTGLRAGQELTLTTAPDKDGRETTQSLVLATNEGEFEVARGADGAFAASAKATPEETREYRRTLAGIKGSLYGTARARGVPDSAIVTMMRTHSYDVDFQREIKAGDLFEVFYATGGAGGTATRGQVLFSSLSTNGRTRSYYRFTDEDGITDYYDETGASSKKPLMKTPINGARMSSGFGMRRHPILGYTKMHGGTDFAAPTGTPILAAGDGTIQVAGRNGGYGNYIKIKHKAGLETAYAHLSRFAKGMKPGKRVSQGDVIGYVGSTGRSTGPHLHYEVHIDGKKKNPLTVKVAGSGRKLEGAELAQFEAERKRIDAMRASVPVEELVASAQP